MCRKLYGAEEPPCDTECITVRPVPENIDAIRVFLATRNQFVKLNERVVDLDVNAVWATIDGYEIKKRQECFDKVMLVARKTLSSYVGE